MGIVKFGHGKQTPAMVTRFTIVDDTQAKLTVSRVGTVATMSIDYDGDNIAETLADEVGVQARQAPKSSGVDRSK